MQTTTKLNTEWDLAKYFYSEPFCKEISQDIESSLTSAYHFAEKYKNKISSLNEDDFLEYLESSDYIFEKAEKVFRYLSLVSSMDIQDTKISKKITELEKIFSDVSELLLFIEEEYKKIGYDKLIDLSNNPKFIDFKNYLLQEANTINYTLSDKEERVCLKLDNANSDNAFEEYTSCFEYDYNGKKLTEEEVLSLRESSNREERKIATELLAKNYNDKKNQIILGNMYSAVCKNDIADMELRGYETVMSSRNISEEVSDESVSTLINEVSKHYGLYHRFLKVKGKLLGIDQMETYDIFARVTQADKPKTEYSFEKGWELYRSVISKVDTILVEYSDDMLNGSRISVYPKPNKSSGAYASYGKNMPSFVLLNWTNTFYDVTVLAHELGHAFHGHLSQKQKNSVFGTPMTTAETASIFNETIMFDSMLSTVDEQEKIVLISSRLDDIFGTIFRQIAYTKFEKRSHKAFADNNPLTYDDYNRIWFEEMKDLYGPNVNLEPELLQYRWSSIPHFQRSPFYCYSYAFGNIISLNIYQNYKDSEDKSEFIKKYHSLLEAGGSDTPENLINKTFGIKFDAKFYETAFKHIEDLLLILEESLFEADVKCELCGELTGPNITSGCDRYKEQKCAWHSK